MIFPTFGPSGQPLLISGDGGSLVPAFSEDPCLCCGAISGSGFCPGVSCNISGVSDFCESGVTMGLSVECNESGALPELVYIMDWGDGTPDESGIIPTESGTSGFYEWELDHDYPPPPIFTSPVYDQTVLFYYTTGARGFALCQTDRTIQLTSLCHGCCLAGTEAYITVSNDIRAIPPPGLQFCCTLPESIIAEYDDSPSFGTYWVGSGQECNSFAGTWNAQIICDGGPSSPGTQRLRIQISERTPFPNFNFLVTGYIEVPEEDPCSFSFSATGITVNTNPFLGNQTCTGTVTSMEVNFV